jgi:toxin ParE1/3/4
MRKYTLVFSPQAINDIEAAVNYYNEQQKGLSKKFATQVQLALKAIKRNPLFVSIRYEDIRCAQVPKFPFLIHYTIDEVSNTVTIAAVYSTYQLPLWD